MADVSGDFEIHLSVRERAATKLAAFAERHGLKLVHIVLDRGATPSQPMLTLAGNGTFAEQQARAAHREARLDEAGITVVRIKIEAAPWCVGVPRTDGHGQKAVEPPGRRPHFRIRGSARAGARHSRTRSVAWMEVGPDQCWYRMLVPELEVFLWRCPLARRVSDSSP
jgi:hypothetical protein